MSIENKISDSIDNTIESHDVTPEREVSEESKEPIFESEENIDSLVKKDDMQSVMKTTIFKREIEETFKEQDENIKKFDTLRKEIKDFEKLEKAFYDISPNTLFFDVKFRDTIVEIIKQKFSRLKNSLPEISTDEFWNETEIDNMFGKGFNPTSLITSAESSEWFTSNLENEDNQSIIISELGPGAGWSTTMLFKELRRQNPESNIYIHSIDKSPHAIATTQALLEYYGINHLLVKDEAEREKIIELIESNELDSCVILSLGHANNLLTEYPDDYFQGFYSTHGTAYFSEREYKTLLEHIEKKGKNNSVFVADSLNPNYVNHLSPLYLVPQMLAPNLMKKVLDKRGIKYVIDEKRLPNASKYFNETIVLKAFNEERADLILRWSNYLIKNLKLNRMLKTKKSLSVTMDVVERYRSDVYPSTKLRDIVDKNKFVEIETNKPDFTIFLETIAFKVKK